MDAPTLHHKPRRRSPNSRDVEKNVNKCAAMIEKKDGELSQYTVRDNHAASIQHCKTSFWPTVTGVRGVQNMRAMNVNP